jgi:ABC-type dipeptide/oligopeptide/nickel transport system permease component
MKHIFKQEEGDLMAKYILIRILWFFLVLFIILTLIFFATNYAMWKNNSMPIPSRIFFNLVFNRYIIYIKNIFTSWNWGTASSGKDAWALLLLHAPRTLRIVIPTFLICLGLGIFLGMLSAIYRHTFLDKLIESFTMVFGAIPNYIWVFVFMIIFGYYLKILPPIPPSEQAPALSRLEGMIIPVVALSFAPIAKFINIIRNELVESFSSDYILLLRVKGLTKSQIFTKHLLKDGLVALMPEIGPTFVFILSGSFLLEYINNIPGVSVLLFQSLFSPMMDFYILAIDIPVAVLVCLFYTGLGLIVILVIDLIYPLIDPRINMQKSKLE